MPVPPAQTIVSGIGSSPAPANLALQGQAVKLGHISGETVKDPVALARVLQELASSHRSTAQVAASNPFASSMLIRNVVTVNGLMVINHQLARPYLGWLAVRIRKQAWQGYETDPQPSLLDPSKQLQINSTSAGAIVDFLIY